MDLFAVVDQVIQLLRSRQEQLALGETPNLAARIQGLAAPDTVVISAATHRLVQGMFADEDLGAPPLKEVAMPVPVYRVTGESGVQSRLEAALTRGLTPLVVGREQEVGVLLERWAQAKDGVGQVVVLNGEAGIGKSRLVQVLKARVADAPHTRWECRCSPYYQQSALYPVIDLWQRALQFQRDDSPEEKLRKLKKPSPPMTCPCRRWCRFWRPSYHSHCPNAILRSVSPPSGRSRSPWKSC
jgi:hypothetical protein